MADLLAWLVSFFVLIALLVCVTYQLMCLADLEFDYINPYDSSSRINKVVLPEFIVQAIIIAVEIVKTCKANLGGVVTGICNYVTFCMMYATNYFYFQVGGKQYTRKQHLVDVTEIFNMLSWEKKQRLIKLFYLLFMLFLSIFWMIYTTLEESDD